MSHRHRSARAKGFLAIVVVTTMALLGSCSSANDGSAAPTGDLNDIPRLSSDASDAKFTVQGSLEQVAVTRAEPKTQIALFGENGRAVAKGTTDSQGSFLFRLVRPGKYRVGTIAEKQVASPPVDVVAVEGSTPDESFYSDQQLSAGSQYIETRDGTTLSALVTLPGPADKGPYPTVVEYSGYSPSKPPTNLIKDRWDEVSKSLPASLTIDDVCALAKFACEAPDQPASIIAAALGFAVVSVNMRGTGCSGGAYDFFEPLQSTDGYDVIETVAAQPWALNHKVGMVGLSYPGISQLFVAATEPPSLAAITPLSVYDDTARGVLAPGGIFNEGFALAWARNVLDDAKPYGQGWERKVVESGDEMCKANQLLRGQNVDTVAKAKDSPYYDPKIADPLNPSLFVNRIKVPVFLTGAFQDEQTGGRFPLLFNRFTNAPVTRFSAWNGAHADGFQPANLVEWKTFLDFYVRGELTERPLAAELFLPLIAEEAFGVQMALPPQRMFNEYPTFEAKRAAYESEPGIRLRLESGAGNPDQPGTPVATWDFKVDKWPLEKTTPLALYFQSDGSMSSARPKDSTSYSTFAFSPELAKLTSFKGDDNDLFKAMVELNWKQEPEGAATVFVSEPLESDTVIIGSASADLWVRSETGEADLGVTLSEVRPDGKDLYVQSGTLRASQRAVAQESTELLPLHTNMRADASDLPKGEFTEARVEIFPFAQVFRAGSRVRLSVHTPGGDKARWTYILKDQPKGTTYDIGHSSQAPSRLVLPVVSGLSGFPAERPDCKVLRAQPCRDFKEYKNKVGD